ncbi:unnamed protein product [Gadus morhua 'NCC']
MAAMFTEETPRCKEQGSVSTWVANHSWGLQQPLENYVETERRQLGSALGRVAAPTYCPTRPTQTGAHQQQTRHLFFDFSTKRDSIPLNTSSSSGVQSSVCASRAAGAPAPRPPGHSLVQQGC